MQIFSLAIKFVSLAVLSTVFVQVSLAQTYSPPPAPRPISQVNSTTETTSATVAAPSNNGRLQINPPTESAPAPTTPASPYMVKAEVRPQSGYSVSAYAGASVAQEDDLESINGVNVSTDSSIMPLAGVKFGYVWPFSEEPIDQFMDETKTGVRLSGGLETELFYLRNETRADTIGGQAAKIESNMFNLMVNATLQAQWHKFRLYVGPGIGMSVIDTDYKLTGFTTENETQANLAFQAIGGLDYFVSPQWSIFGEYKYFIVDGFKVSNSGNTADLDQLGQHLLTVGVRRHF